MNKVLATLYDDLPRMCVVVGNAQLTLLRELTMAAYNIGRAEVEAVKTERDALRAIVDEKPIL